MSIDPARTETVGLIAWVALMTGALWVVPDDLVDAWSMIAAAIVVLFGVLSWRRGRTSGWLAVFVGGLMVNALVSLALLSGGLETLSRAVDCLAPFAAITILTRVYRLSWRGPGVVFDLAIGSGVAVLGVWTLVVVPAAHHQVESAELVWMSISSTLWAIAVVVMVTAAARHRQPTAVVGVSLACVLVGEIGYLGDFGELWSLAERTLVAPYVAAYATSLGFFLPHTSQRLLRSRRVSRRENRWRIRGAAVAVLLAVAFSLTILRPPIDNADTLVRLALGLVIAGCVSFRIAGVAQRDAVEVRSQFMSASRDALTGCLNRVGLTLEWQHRVAVGRSTPTAVFAVEIDKLEDFDLLYGAAVRDSLVEVAVGRMQSVCGDEVLVGAQGDGKLLVVAPVDRVQADMLATRLLGVLSAPTQATTGGFLLRCSVGYSTSQLSPNQARLDVLFRQALRAAHQANASLGGSCAVCADDMPGTLRSDHQDVMEEMSASVAAGRVEVEHRYMIDLESGSTVGLTSCASWVDERGGRHTRDEGGSPRVGMEMLAQQLLSSLNHMARERRDGRCGTEVGLTIGVAAAHVVNPTLLTVLSEACRRSGVGAEVLTIELHESDLVPNDESLALALEALREQGVSIGVDRFGETRGVSLNRLRAFPLSQVSLSELLAAQVGQNSNRRFVRALVAAGKELGFTVWAPLPVDTPTLRRALRSAGVTVAEVGVYANSN